LGRTFGGLRDAAEWIDRNPKRVGILPVGSDRIVGSTQSGGVISRTIGSADEQENRSRNAYAMTVVKKLSETTGSVEENGNRTRS
jgi:hypothetical protein